jgi:hypothetical protein
MTAGFSASAMCGGVDLGYILPVFVGVYANKAHAILAKI